MNFKGYRWRHRHRSWLATGQQVKEPVIRIALAGNPNSGKTSIFNAITGQHQRVGNYPGVTVEKKFGRIFYRNRILEVIDLPGTYSLSAYSLDEMVARDFLVNEKPDIVIDILDSTNLERHLYLLLQFQEMGVPLIGALNMADEAESKGLIIDVENLSQILGIPLVRTVGNKGEGIEELLTAALDLYNGRLSSSQRHLNYGVHVEEAHNQVIAALEQDEEFTKKYPAHWLAIKLLEEDPDAQKKVQQEHTKADTVLSVTESVKKNLTRQYQTEARNIVSEQRYAYIHGAIKEAVRQNPPTSPYDLTERIDRIVLHRFLGIPIFLGVMFLIYQFTFRLGNPLSDLIGNFFTLLGRAVHGWLPEGILQDLISNGIIGGVGSVIVFLPLVVLLMLGLAFLEDTGYMARAAFVMDKFFHLFGLHGRSFIPFMVATGCAVPGVMSARLLANPKDRIVTILVTPFMMCGAKAPVIAILTAAFFPEHSALVFWGVWMLSWLMAFCVALIFRRTLFRGEQTPFVMELPPYRLPTLQTILLHMWQKAREYLKKAGTIILAASIVIWFLFTFPHSKANDTGVGSVCQSEILAPAAQGGSYAVRIGRAVEPVLKLAGFDWKLGVALFAGVAAKEVIISTLGILYGIENAAAPAANGTSNLNIRDLLRNDPDYSRASGLALIIFVLFYTPCLATLAMIKKELGSWKWPLFEAGYTLTFAFLLAIASFQLGKLLLV